MNDYREYLEIDLKDMFFTILKSWKLILIGMLIGALLGGAYSFVNARSAAQKAMQKAQEEAAIAAGEAEEETKALTDKEKEILLQDAIANAQADTAMEKEIQEARAKAESAIEAIKDPGSKLSEKEISDVDLAYSAYLQYQAIETSEDVHISDDARVELIRATQALVVITNTFTDEQKAYYSSLFEDKDKAIKHIENNLEAEIQEIQDKAAIEAEGRAKVSEIKRQAETGDIEAVLDEGTSDVEQTVAISSTPSLSSVIKYVILFAILGAFIVICLLACKYLFIPVLKTEDDMRTAFKLPIIGEIKDNNNDDLQFVSNAISACARKAELNKVLLVSSCGDTNRDNADSIIANINNSDIEISTASSIIDNPQAAKAVDSGVGVILLENIGISLYENISREIEICNNYGTKIIGTVIVR